MHFRSQKKLQGEISLSESIESDRDGNSLQLMDVIGMDDTMLEDLYDRDSALRLRRLVNQCLTRRESESETSPCSFLRERKYIRISFAILS